MFKWHLERAKKEVGKRQIFEICRGGEFTSNKFEIFCNDRGIKTQTSGPRTPPQNGIVERRNTFVMDYASTLMMEKNVSLKY